ncbi:MAG: transporter substrate-binding domain-containing protein [Alphaproteobacteria bacterium]|nr:transporter substrate-binding domain-containing protein [Alphaproteobacteria bacterium]
MKRKWWSLAGWLLAALAVAALPAAAESTLEKIKRTGKFQAGVRFDFPPVGSIDTAGKPDGFGPDIARIMAEKLGVQVEFVQVTSKTRIPLLENGSIDADIGPTTPTVKRDEVVDFSIPYVWDGVTIVVRKGDSLNVKDYGPPKKLATTQGSFIIDLLKEQLPNADIVLFQEFPDAIVALQNRKVDAVGVNRFNGVAFAKKNPNLEVGKDFFVDPWAIGVRENDSKWRDFVNLTLQELWFQGKYQQLYAKHFGQEPNFMLWSQFRLQPGVGEKN